MQLTDRAKAELDLLTLEQRRVVLPATLRKLCVARRTGKMPYRYDLCAVCQFMGSSEENSEPCQTCFIHSACQEPFVSNFKEDEAASLDYFESMEHYLVLESASRPDALVVGGTWDLHGGKASKIAATLADLLHADLYNGGWTDELQQIPTTTYSLIVWMADVANDAPKLYPPKKKGGVLVLSKVMREGYTSLDAAKRIFAAHGNAVIEIYKEDRLRFRLADALNNPWAETSEVEELAAGIASLVRWTNQSIRFPVVRADDNAPEALCISSLDVKTSSDLDQLLTLVRRLSLEVENSIGERYFGNVSTRCVSLFPSTWRQDGVLVSPRNLDKRFIEPEDMVLVWRDGRNRVLYAGARKPSVDTHIQLAIYESRPRLNYLIHGHAYVKGFPATRYYYPCGDLREAVEVLPLIPNGAEAGCINLSGHGFLIFATCFNALKHFTDQVYFINRL